MGLFVYFEGEFECVRCRRTSTALIQTKLLRHEVENCNRVYRIGDTDELVGLDDYLPLETWDGSSSLTIAVGEWDCPYCGLSWQWAKVVFDYERSAGRGMVTIRELSGLQPRHAADLAEIQFIDSYLARLSGLWPDPPDFNWAMGLEQWRAHSVSSRCELTAVGFTNWCREVARSRGFRGGSFRVWQIFLATCFPTFQVVKRPTQAARKICQTPVLRVSKNA